MAGVSGVKFLGSSTLRRRLKRDAALLGGGAALAVFVSPAFAMLLVGASLAIFVMAARISAPEEQCGFCGHTRQQVRELVASPDTSICDACVVWSAQIIANQHYEKSRGDWMIPVLTSLPYRAPFAVSGPLIDYAATLEDLNRNEFVDQAARVGNHEALARALAHPKTSSDWVNLGVALNNLGRHEESIAATRNATGEDQQVFVLNNVAGSKLLAGASDAGELRALLADLQKARDLCLSRKSPNVLQFIYGNLADVRVRLGEPAVALQLLEEAAKYRHHNVRRLLVKHAALTALGRHDEAKAVAAQAKNDVHPETREAAEVNALIS